MLTVNDHLAVDAEEIDRVLARLTTRLFPAGIEVRNSPQSPPGIEDHLALQ